MLTGRTPPAEPPVTQEMFRGSPLFVNSNYSYGDPAFEPKNAPSTLPATIAVTALFHDFYAGVAEHLSYRVRLDGEVLGDVPARLPADPTWPMDQAYAEIQLERTGVYTAELLLDGEPFGFSPARLAVGMVPCLGGEPMLVVHPVGPSLDGETLTVWRWHRWDEPTPYLAEWRHDGEIVHSETGFQSDWLLREHIETFDEYGGYELSGTPAWRLVREKYSPPSSLAAGSWSVRVVVEGEDAFEAELQVDAGGPGALVVRSATVSEDDLERLSAVPTPPFVRPTDANALLAVTPEEIRALSRSEEATVLRENVNSLSKERKVGLDATVDSVDETAGRDHLSRKERQRLMDESVDDVVKEHAREQRQNRAQAKRDAKTLKKLILSLGGPWQDDEHPVNHSSMLY